MVASVMDLHIDNDLPEGVSPSDPRIKEIDQALCDFLAVMRHKMLKNLHKSGWQDMPFDLLWARFLVEVEEFKIAMKYETTTDAQHESADIGNYLMMMFNRLPGHGTEAERAKAQG